MKGVNQGFERCTNVIDDPQVICWAEFELYRWKYPKLIHVCHKMMGSRHSIVKILENMIIDNKVLKGWPKVMGVVSQ